MLRKIQEKIQSMIAFAPVLFYGRGVFQYTFGMIPHRRPVHVVGKYYNLQILFLFMNSPLIYETPPKKYRNYLLL